MNLLSTITKELVKLTQKHDDWWVEISTAEPRCIYYFGPFETSAVAKAAYSGYVEDLQGKHAQGISVDIKRCQPTELTIFDEGA